MSTVIEEVQTRKSHREQAAETAYRALVRTVADGGKATVEHVEKVLSDAGRSPEDLRVDVNTRNRRREMAAHVAKSAAIDRERQELEERAIEANAKLEKAEMEHAAVMNPIRVRVAEINTYRQQLHRYRDELELTAAPDVVERYRAAGAALEPLRARLHELRLAQMKRPEGVSDIAQAEAGAGFAFGLSRGVSELRQEGERKVAAAKAADEEMPGLLKQIREAEAVEQAALAELWKA